MISRNSAGRSLDLILCLCFVRSTLNPGRTSFGIYPSLCVRKSPLYVVQKNIVQYPFLMFVEIIPFVSVKILCLQFLSCNFCVNKRNSALCTSKKYDQIEDHWNQYTHKYQF